MRRVGLERQRHFELEVRASGWVTPGSGMLLVWLLTCFKSR